MDDVSVIDAVPSDIVVDTTDFLFHHGTKPCPCCKGTKWRKGPGILAWESLINPVRPRLIECTQCGTAHAPALKSKQYTHREGADTAGASEAANHRQKARLNVDRLTPYLRGTLPSSPSAIVVGCSTGFEIEALLNSSIPFSRVDGLEPSHMAVAVARERFRNDPRVTVFEGLVSDFPDKNYDLVMANMVWEHIPRPDQALGIVGQHQLRGGLVSLQTPRYDNSFPRFVRGRLWYGVHDNHLWYYTRKGLEALVTNGGYSPLDTLNVPRVATPGFIAWRVIELSYIQMTRYFRIKSVEQAIAARYGLQQQRRENNSPKREFFVRIDWLRDAMSIVAVR